MARARFKHPELFAYFDAVKNSAWFPLLVHLGADIKLPQIRRAPRIKNITRDLVRSLTQDQLRWVRSMQSSLEKFRDIQIEIGGAMQWCPFHFGKEVVKRWLDWTTKILALAAADLAGIQ